MGPIRELSPAALLAMKAEDVRALTEQVYTVRGIVLYSYTLGKSYFYVFICLLSPCNCLRVRVRYESVCFFYTASLICVCRTCNIEYFDIYAIYFRPYDSCRVPNRCFYMILVILLIISPFILRTLLMLSRPFAQAFRQIACKNIQNGRSNSESIDDV
jgi:hypothetical protein